MKRLYFVCRMFVLSLFFVGYSCSSNVDDFSVVKKTEAQEVINEEEAYQNLILYLEQMDSLYNIKVYDESSRAGFFAKLWAVLKCDAMGYKWGVEHGQTWQVSLIISSVCSIIGIVLVATQSQFGSWDVNDNWQIYTPIKEWEKIGFEHNRLVQETVSKYPSIRSGNATPATILSNVELSASRLGISGTLSSLYRAELLAILNSQNFSTFEAKLEQSLQSVQTQFVVSFVQRIVQLTDKSLVHTYTQSVLSQIDTMSISDKDDLKCMICICENSRFLWNVVE